LVIFADSSYIYELNDQPNRPADPRLWQTGTQDFLKLVGSSAGRAVMLGAPPGAKNLQICATKVSVPADCTATPSGHFDQMNAAEAAAAEAAGAKYVDTKAWFCASNRCPAVIGTTPVYWDGQHLTGIYSKSLSAFMADALTAS
jgi:hypothetical protein